MLKRNLPIGVVILGYLVIIAGFVKILNFCTLESSNTQNDVIMMTVIGLSIVFAGFFLGASWEVDQTVDERARRLSTSLTGLFFSVVILLVILFSRS